MMKPKFTRATVHKYTEGVARQLERIIIRELQILGAECVNIARTQGDYMDQTGNLRSSIGFELYANDKLVDENFEPHPGAGSTDGSEGKMKGKALATEIGPLGTYTLVIVAGMEYAEEVEARGRDVLSSANLYAETQMAMIKERILRLMN